jgi:hypothetical protein
MAHKNPMVQCTIGVKLSRMINFQAVDLRPCRASPSVHQQFVPAPVQRAERQSESVRHAFDCYSERLDAFSELWACRWCFVSIGGCSYTKPSIQLYGAGIYGRASKWEGQSDASSSSKNTF